MRRGCRPLLACLQVGAHKGFQVLGLQRAAEVVALHLVATLCAQIVQLLGGFHAFGDVLMPRLWAICTMAVAMAWSSGSVPMSRTNDWSILSWLM